MAPLLSDLFLYLYEADFVQSLIKAGKNVLPNNSISHQYIDDVLSLNSSKFSEYLDFVYPRELEIKDTTEIATSALYLDCYLYSDYGKLATRLLL